MDLFQSPAQMTYWSIQGQILFWIVSILGTACFAYIVARRMIPLNRGQRDFRLDRAFTRLGRLLQFWLGQWKHPRYKGAGALHILIFAGFLILVAHTVSLLVLGFSSTFRMPGSSEGAGHLY